ncbi:hypothetical protein DCC62_00915 [candidate division KSB1 bacterium]|nr:MAG: hypothetical protein DCC62_00915 [candidate division KSB1 bacterium]
MNGLTYTLRLLEPVLANSLAGDANSARSLMFVPGGLVRGALIGAYLRDKNLSSGDTMDEEFRRLFLTDVPHDENNEAPPTSSNGKFERFKTRYLHAYPIAEDRRTLPAPLAWKVRKKDAAGDEITPTDLCNFAVRDPIEEDDDLEKEKGSWEKVKFECFYQAGETAYSSEVPIYFNLHTQRDAVYGRALEGRGAVYRYEALPAGLQVQGAILTATKEDAKYLETLLKQNSDSLVLGKARTAGYGRSKVEAVGDLSNWREARTWKRTTSDNEEEFDDELPTEVESFILTFLSEGLVRDDHGQFTLDPLPALKKRLGVTLKHEPEVPLEKCCEVAPKIFRAVEIVGGFNRTWGLPLPQVPAIAAGSVFVLKAEPEVKWEVLKQLEETGLGERRNEGFGRVKIDYYQPDTVKWTKAKAENETPKEVPLTKAAETAAAFMLKRLLQRDVDRKVLKFVREKEVREEIPNSQLSRWRVIIRSVLAQGTEPSRLTKFAAAERTKRSSAWQKMDRARLRTIGSPNEDEPSPRLTDWIDDVLTGSHSPWRQMGYADDKPPMLEMGKTIKFEANETMAFEYKLRLIDAVLAECAKENKTRRKKLEARS